MTREIDSIAVYGRSGGLAVHELISLAEDTYSERPGWIAAYERGLAKYRHREFSDAILDFEAVLRQRPDDHPASILLERCKHLKQSDADETWQPIATLTSKMGSGGDQWWAGQSG